MKYLKVFTDFAEQMEALNDTEVGRLFRAMLLYAETGEVTDLKGNERFLWGSAKVNIDYQRGSYDNKIARAENARNALSNIRDEKSNIRKSQSNIRKKNLILDQDKDQDKDQDTIVALSGDKACSGEPERGIDLSAIIDGWNSLGLSEIKKIPHDTKRYKSLVARVREYGEDAIFQAFDCIRESDFLQGKNKNGFTVTFDWLVLPNNFPKVIGGNYANRTETVTKKDRYSWMDEVDL